MSFVIENVNRVVLTCATYAQPSALFLAHKNLLKPNASVLPMVIICKKKLIEFDQTWSKQTKKR